TRFGLLPVRSPLLGESRLISFPPGTEMFHFPGFPPAGYGFTDRCQGMTPGRLPHSEIPGSMPACGSPRRIGACPVLHRPLAPRHPPCAFVCFTTYLLQSDRLLTRPQSFPLCRLMIGCLSSLCSCQGAKPTLPLLGAPRACPPGRLVPEN